MKDCTNALTGLLFVLYLTSIAVLSCGCNESNIKSGKQHDYVSPYEDIEFQQGAERPPTAMTYYSMAKILIDQGRFNDAELLLQKVIDKAPKFLPAYNNLAEIYIRNRRTNEAVNILSRALNENDSDPKTINNLGMCWMMRKDYEQALQMFTKAAGLEPENTRYRANMAVALGLMGRDEEALALYRQILPEKQAIKNINIIRQARGKVSKTND
jgi:Flp pilus assembly protein TadD